MKQTLSTAVKISLVKPDSFIKLVFTDKSGSSVGFLLHGGKQFS